MDVKKILNNKRILLAGGIGLLIIIIIIIALAMKGDNEKKTLSLNEKLNELGATFYETKYFPTVGDKQSLADFKDSGINISLTNIDVLLPLDKETENLLKKKKCNNNETKIIVFPKSPYNVKDYSLKVELACEE